MTPRAERQSARMSIITNDGLTPFDRGCFIAVLNGNSGRQRLIILIILTPQFLVTSTSWQSAKMELTGTLVDADRTCCACMAAEGLARSLWRAKRR